MQENAPERVEVKRALWAEMDRLAPADAILASSTSALLPSRFTEGLKGRRRCLVCHPLNPPYVIPAVELVPAPWTAPEAMTRAADVMRAIGEVPIVMRKEIEGFVMNRLQAALVEEAFKLVAGGYCDAEDVDIGLREGLALRWSFMGPFETGDLNAPGGIRDYATRYRGVFDSVLASALPRPDWSGPVLDEIEAVPRRPPAAHARGQRRAPALARPAADGAGPAQAAGEGRGRGLTPGPLPSLPCPGSTGAPAGPVGPPLEAEGDKRRSGQPAAG